MSTTSEGDADAWFVVGGLFLITVAGICNGSWNAAFSPSTNLAVGERNDFNRHHAFALFQTYAVVLNVPVCLAWAGGPSRVRAILERVPSESIMLVCVFSAVWGVGTLLFGLACRVAGVGLGTNLSIGAVAVIGTLLPLLVEETLVTPAGAVVCAGLAICCVGLALATKALAQRDKDQLERRSGGSVAEENEREEEEKEEVENGHRVNNDDNEDNDAHDADTIKARPTDNDDDTTNTPTWKKILVCVLTALAAVQLQFAFVFGSPITDAASSNSLPGSAPEGGGAAVIWLLAITFGAPVSVVDGLRRSPVPLREALRVAPWWRHVRLIVTTSLPWVAHIHLYGACTTSLLPPRLAAAVGWPLLMIVTVAQSMALSVWPLREWGSASAATVRTLRTSTAVTLVGAAVLMASVAAPLSSLR